MRLKLMLACVTFGSFVGSPAPAHATVSVVIEPPIVQPPAIAISWAPPPILVDPPPPIPFVGAVWIGGYWTWDGDWVWARGRWVAPPEPDWVWTVPYYEHRGAHVVFVGGFWARPGVVFRPPPVGIHVEIARPRLGVTVGSSPMGPQGVFVPPPPGSRLGAIVPAPIGTPPAVVMSAPPVVRPGMVVRPRAHGHFSVVAPAGATRGRVALHMTVPAKAHLAAARPSHDFAQRGESMRRTAPIHPAPHAAPMRHAEPMRSPPHAAPMRYAEPMRSPPRAAPYNSTRPAVKSTAPSRPGSGPHGHR